MSSYHLDDTTCYLSYVEKRLQNSDLIPSQQPLLEDLEINLVALRTVGIGSLADLRAALESKASLSALAAQSGIDPNYLALLKRAISGFFPKPRTLADVDWLRSDIVSRLKTARITNTQKLFDAAAGGVAPLASRLRVDRSELRELIAISDLCRIQWVSLKYARALLATGHRGAADVAKADPEELVQAIADANQDDKFYRGKVGLRDVRRLVAVAGYVPGS